MIAPSGERLATALIVCGLCAAAIGLAWPLARFGFAESRGSEPAASVQLRGLATSPVVGVLARGEALVRWRSSDASPAGVPRRVADIEALLSLAPLASGAWLQLAAARAAAGAPLQKVSSALALSQLTGPNEPGLRPARAAFGLPLWPGLSSEARRSVLVDLLRGGWERMGGDQRLALRLAIQRATAETRQELRDQLTRSGAAAEPLIRDLGLASPPAR